MTEHEAKAALRQQGIRRPSRQLVQDWLRLQQSQEWALEVPEVQGQEHSSDLETPPESASGASAAHPPRASSESNLEPLLRARGQLERPAGRRKAGRPRIVAPFFKALAVACSDGTPLRQALVRCGVHGLSEREIRSLYRNVQLKTMRQEARQKWLAEWGASYKRKMHRSPTCRPKGAGSEFSGQSWRFRSEL
jgi:hypothetical protein